MNQENTRQPNILQADAVRDFTAKLTELSLQTGIGLAGEITLFCLEAEDRQFGYQADDESRLTLV